MRERIRGAGTRVTDSDIADLAVTTDRFRFFFRLGASFHSVGIPS